MGLKPEILKKKQFTLYKAFYMKPGETMQVDIGGDDYAMTPSLAIENFLSSITDTKELEAIKGEVIQLLTLNFNMQKLQANEHLDEILQDGSDVHIAIKNFAYRMQIKNVRLESFEYAINPKDQGQTFQISKVVMTTLK